MRSERVTGRALCTTRCVTNPPPIPYPVLFYPFLVCPLRRALCATPLLRSPPLPHPPSVRARCRAMCETFPCPSRPSPSLLWFSGLLSSLVCPTSLALPVSSSHVPTFPCCKTLRRHVAHCTFGGGLPSGNTLRRLAVSRAPARRGWPARLWGTFLFVPLVRSNKPGHTMCIQCSVSSTPLSPRYHLLPSALQPARARCGAICEATLPLRSPSPFRLPGPVLSSLTLPCPSSRATGSLAFCLSVPVLPLSPLACTVQSNVRGNPPTPSIPFCPPVSWTLGKLHAPYTAPACGLFPSTPYSAGSSGPLALWCPAPALPPPPSPALFPS